MRKPTISRYALPLLFVFAIVVFFCAGPPLAGFVTRSMLGAPLIYGSVRMEPGRVSFLDATWTSPTGTFKAAVDRIDVAFGIGGPFSVRADGAHLTVQSGGSFLIGPHVASLMRRIAAAGAARVDVAGGDATFIDGAGQNIAHASFTLSVAKAPKDVTYDLRMSAPEIAPQLLGALGMLPEGARGAAGALRNFTLHAASVASGARSLELHANADDAQIALANCTCRVALSGALAIENGAVQNDGLKAAAGTAQITLDDPLLVRDLGLARRVLSSAAAKNDLASIELESLVPGALFGRYVRATKDGPLAVHVVMLSPKREGLRIETAIADDKVINTGARTSELGKRTGAIAGINGDYFDIGRTYEPQGILVQHGALLRMPNDRVALSVHHGTEITFDRYSFSGELRTAHATRRITMFNVYPPRDIAFVNPQHGKLPPVSGVKMALLSPLGGDKYRVERIVDGTSGFGPTLGLAFGANAWPYVPQSGEVVAVAYDTAPSMRGVSAAIGGGPLLLHDGKWFEDPKPPAPEERDVRWPVVGVGKMPDGALIFAEVDGRHPERSIGMTRPEFAELLRVHGAVEAMALDSGGSATLVAGRPTATLRSTPSDDGGERFISDGLFIYAGAPKTDNRIATQ